jgi:cytochrome c5
MMLRRQTVLALLAAAAVAAAAAAAVSRAQQPLPQAVNPTPGKLTPSGITLPAGRNSDYVTRVCSTCHSLANVTYARFDGAGWYKEVLKMNAFGAGIPKTRIRGVAHYLVANFGLTS